MAKKQGSATQTDGSAERRRDGEIERWSGARTRGGGERWRPCSLWRRRRWQHEESSRHPRYEQAFIHQINYLHTRPRSHFSLPEFLTVAIFVWQGMTGTLWLGTQPNDTCPLSISLSLYLPLSLSPQLPHPSSCLKISVHLLFNLKFIIHSMLSSWPCKGGGQASVNPVFGPRFVPSLRPAWARGSMWWLVVLS